MPIQPIPLYRNTSIPHAAAPLQSQPKPFVRESNPELSAGVNRAIVKDGGPIGREWAGNVFQACNRLGLAPGQHKVMEIGGTSMVLYRTNNSDAYVLQTPQEFRARIGGLHLSNRAEIKYNNQPIEFGGTTPEAMKGFQQFELLAKALNIPMPIHV